ncbi:hypothetical protein JOE65_002285 [Arthrobacter roseus]|nr:hypothetical protein [Arthrobacter roseus]
MIASSCDGRSLVLGLEPFLLGRILTSDSSQFRKSLPML